MFGAGHAAPEQEFNMILTVTMNPSIDTRYQLVELIARINRRVHGNGQNHVELLFRGGMTRPKHTIAR